MPDPLPISACVIVADDPLLGQALRSVRPWVKEICVVRTAGVGNPLPSLIDRFMSGSYVDPEISDFSFSKARNAVLDLATQPWWVWLDSDDVVRGGEAFADLIREGESIKGSGEVGFLLPYEYAYADEPGKSKVITRQYRERFFSNPRAWQWEHPIHEVVGPKPGVVNVGGRAEAPIWEHHRNAGKSHESTERNLRLLEKYVKARPGDVRQLYYYGSALACTPRIEEAITVLSQYVEVGFWDDERCLACLRLVDLHLATNRNVQALTYGFKALAMRESWSEGHFALARIYYRLASVGGPHEMRDWQRCVYWARRGLDLPPTETVLWVNPVEREHDIHEILNIALNKVGDVRGAFESAEKGFKANPNNTNLKLNRAIYGAWIARQKSVESVRELLTYKGEHEVVDQSVKQGVDEILGLLSVTPQSVQAPAMSTSSSGNGFDIVFACGDGWETWNPDSIDNGGIGGSETAVIEMAKRFAARGNRVRVYTSCGQEKTYDGVQYLPTAKLLGAPACDVLVAWRYAGLLQAVRAKKRVLWVHDVFAYVQTGSDLMLADTIFCLSEWHKEFFIQYHKNQGHELDERRVVVTRNGLDPKLFEQKVERDPHKCVYSSSPDRGLELLLEVWPRIRENAPDATLHIFYGFDNWKKAAPNELRIAQLETRISQLKDQGVVYRGRIGQRELAREFLSAGVWAYPTNFTETFCISAIQAMAAKLHVVTMPLAALPETLSRYHVWWTDTVYGTWDCKNRFVENTVSALQAPEHLRPSGIDLASLSWDRVVDQWEKLFDIGAKPVQVPAVSVDPEEELQRYVRGEIAELPAYVVAT